MFSCFKFRKNISENRIRFEIKPEIIIKVSYENDFWISASWTSQGERQERGMPLVDK